MKGKVDEVKDERGDNDGRNREERGSSYKKEMSQSKKRNDPVRNQCITVDG